MTRAEDPTADGMALYRAICESFQSPNEEDRNGETANVVDGLYRIARAIDRLALAIQPNREEKERGQ